MVDLEKDLKNNTEKTCQKRSNVGGSTQLLTLIFCQVTKSFGVWHLAVFNLREKTYEGGLLNYWVQLQWKKLSRYKFSLKLKPDEVWIGRTTTVVQYEGVPFRRYILEEYLNDVPGFLTIRHWTFLEPQPMTSKFRTWARIDSDWAAMLRNTLWPQWRRNNLSHKQFQRHIASVCQWQRK